MKKIPGLPSLNFFDFIRSPLLPFSNGRPWHIDSERDKIQFYALGRWAIIDAVRLLNGNNEKSIIWFPAYFCDNTLSPIRGIENVSIRFYPVNPNLTPNWRKLEPIFPSNKKTKNLFVLTHYFGFANDVQGAVQFCQTQGCLLLEDCAHVLRPFGEIGQYGKALIFSPRKVLEIPDGAILIVREGKSFPFVTPPKSDIANALLWVGKSFAKQILRLFPFPMKRKVFTPPVGSGEVASINVRGITSLSRKLLGLLEGNLERVSEIRRNHYLLLEKFVQTHSEVLSLMFATLPANVTPYFFPFLVKENRNELVEKLRKIGIPAGVWPDLPPEVTKDTAFSVENELVTQIITLPIHHHLTESDIQYMINNLDKILNETRQCH